MLEEALECCHARMPEKALEYWHGELKKHQSDRMLEKALECCHGEIKNIKAA